MRYWKNAKRESNIMTNTIEKNIEIINPNHLDAKWNLSAMFAHQDFLLKTIKLFQENYNVNPIEQVHDSVNCKWSGGRLSNNTFLSEKNMLEVFDKYKALGINIYFIFSNHLIERFDLKDSYCNMVLEVLNSLEGQNGIVVSSDLLSNYIRKKYPKLKQISSVIKTVQENGKGNVKFYKNLEKRFDRVVIHTDDNENFELLDKLDRNKIEILVNEPCRKNCAYKKIHFNLYANIQKGIKVTTSMKELDDLVIYCKSLDDIRNKCLVPQDNLNKIYDMGFRYFKLQGRMEYKEHLMFDIASYIVNEKYQSQFMHMIQG